MKDINKKLICQVHHIFVRIMSCQQVGLQLFSQILQFHAKIFADTSWK